MRRGTLESMLESESGPAKTQKTTNFSGSIKADRSARILFQFPCSRAPSQPDCGTAHDENGCPISRQVSIAGLHYREFPAPRQSDLRARRARWLGLAPVDAIDRPAHDAGSRRAWSASGTWSPHLSSLQRFGAMSATAPDDT